MPSSAPPTVWMKPKTEAAVPATAPSGSMDEFMLDAAQPKTNCTIINRLKNNQSGMKPARLKATEDAAADIDDQREMAQPAHAGA